MKTYLFGVYMFFAGALFITCFCRLAHTSKKNTARPVRWAFTGLAIFALTCLFAPLWDFEPGLLLTAGLGAMFLVQWVTAHYWRRGTPDQFQVQR